VFFFLSKILDLSFAPLSWVIVLLGAALVLRRRRPRAAPLLVVAALALAVLFSLEPVANSLTRSLETPRATTMHDGVTYDAALLLGGLVDERATESYGPPSYNDNAERMLTTFDLLRTGRVRYAVVSGGPVEGAKTKVIEAQAIADQLVAWGIAPDRIVVDGRAVNTRENAVNCARIAHERGWEQLVVVTSAFHMPRALACFRAVDLPVDALAVDYRSFDPETAGASWLPRAQYLAQSTAALRERAGLLVYKARGYAR
jgi:uncharacterized SAM-binding protein YcdF (DUF218 family)